MLAESFFRESLLYLQPCHDRTKLMRLPGSFISVTPPSILPARVFLSKLISLLSNSNPTFVGKTMPIPSSAVELSITSSSTLNWLQMVVLTVQRAPAPQAPGGPSTAAKAWESLNKKYSSTITTTTASSNPGGPNVALLQSQAVKEALAHLSTGVFKIPPPRGQGGAPDLMNLMGSLFGGGGGGGLGALGGGPRR